MSPRVPLSLSGPLSPAVSPVFPVIPGNVGLQVRAETRMWGSAQRESSDPDFLLKRAEYLSAQCPSVTTQPVPVQLTTSAPQQSNFRPPLETIAKLEREARVDKLLWNQF